MLQYPANVSPPLGGRQCRFEQRLATVGGMGSRREPATSTPLRGVNSKNATSPGTNNGYSTQLMQANL